MENASQEWFGQQPQTGAAVDAPGADLASQPFVGRWNRLVSTTNWEKGRIITEWRSALRDAGEPPAACSDEAWARRVGGVTGQHAGRLRRVYQRFGKTYKQYEGLYWSHFHAALDWDDAELWLEGAVQSRWSVAQMRRQRWEAMGAVAEDAPRDEQIVVAEKDEDFEPALEQEPTSHQVPSELAEVAGDAAADKPDTSVKAEPGTAAADRGAASGADRSAEATVEAVRPFEHLAELPDDLAEAFEAFKLAILRHKTDGWSEISRDDVLGALDALKQLTMAPSVD